MGAVGRVGKKLAAILSEKIVPERGMGDARGRDSE
jgi:hypothetical protein